MGRLMLHNKRGFTLLEMMFVLSITLILAALGFRFHMPKVPETQEVRLLSDTFKNARMKACALKEKQTIDVEETDIYIYDSHDSHHIKLAKGYRFETTHTFSYNTSGRIKRPKTLILEGPKHSYRFVFQIGSGTFYVK